MDIKVNQAFSTILSILVFCYTRPSQFRKNQVNSSLAPLFPEHTLADIFFFLAERPQRMCRQVLSSPPDHPALRPRNEAHPSQRFSCQCFNNIFSPIPSSAPPAVAACPLQKQEPRKHTVFGALGLVFTFVSTQYSQLPMAIRSIPRYAGAVGTLLPYCFLFPIAYYPGQ